MELESTDLPAPVMDRNVSRITSEMWGKALARLAVNPEVLLLLIFDYGIELLQVQYPGTGALRFAFEIVFELSISVFKWVQPRSTPNQCFAVIIWVN